MRGSFLRGALLLVLSAPVALGCGSSGGSGGSGSTGGGSSGGTGATTTASPAFQAQVASAFSDPGAAIGSIPSSLAGVATWNFYTSAQGTVAIGTDASGADKAELALLTDATGATTGAAYAIASDLPVTGATLAQAVNADLMTAQASASTQSIRIQDLVGGADGGLTSNSGTTLVANCASSLTQNFGLGTLELLGIGAGVLVGALTCPETIGAGCGLGAAIVVGTVGLASATSTPSISSSCTPS